MFIKVTEQRFISHDSSWVSQPILIPTDKITSVNLFGDESDRKCEIVSGGNVDFVVETIDELLEMLNKGEK